MKHFNSLGFGPVKDAVEQATRGLSNPMGIIYYADYEEIDEIDGILAAKYPGIDRLAIAGSVFNNGKISDHSNQAGLKKQNGVGVMAFFDDALLRFGIVKDADKTPLLSARKLDTHLKEINAGADNTLCITYNLVNEEGVVSTFKPILNKYKVKMMGGSVGGFYGRDAEPFVMLNGVKYQNATAYVLVKNTVGKVKVYRQDIYEQIDDELLTITKVKDGLSRNLQEVNGIKMNKIYMP